MEKKSTNKGVFFSLLNKAIDTNCLKGGKKEGKYHGGNYNDKQTHLRKTANI